MHRVVAPELLDDLLPSDPQAIHSRGDLRCLNFLMGHAGILRRAWVRAQGKQPPPKQRLRLIELGAGDGTVLLRIARSFSILGITADATLIDRQSLVSKETRHEFDRLNWSIESISADAFDWLESSVPSPSIATVMIANLFLHHFRTQQLEALFQRVAATTNLFLACEPRRSICALTAAHCLPILGCNRITQQDALVSVRAGFTGHELTGLWPTTHAWHVTEHPAGMFSHLFCASCND